MTTHWIVGVEPDGNHDGPLHFAGSIHRRSRESIGWTATYVIPGEAVVGAEQSRKLQARAEPACNRALVRTDARDAVRQVNVIEADAVDTGLEEAIARHEASACVIGRRALRQELKLQRLGPVARHLLRRLPTALIIVPPDWIAVHDGPVIFATDLSDSSSGAARFAHDLAQHLVTPLVVVYVARHGDWSGPHVESPTFQASRQRIRQESEHALDAWAKEHGLGDSVRVVHVGDPVSDVAVFAKEEQASLVVCGSRRVGTLARLFGHSVASELAAVASVPVAVVPSS
jgi:nucleotide-binding universal stress UspA family protein